MIRDKRKIDATGQAKSGAAANDGTAKAGEIKPEATMGQTGTPATESADAPEPEVVSGEIMAEAEPSAEEAAPNTGLGAELEALRSELDERVKDLQRMTAEYANYRKRVDRDRGAVAEQTIGTVASSLLPILDDLDRAREHDDLVGPFASVAEQLTAALAKFGLSGFGEPGDAFDPTRHEAVTHQTSADVTAPTCVAVMRRGYLLGDRLLRAALVAVADPE